MLDISEPFHSMTDKIVEHDGISAPCTAQESQGKS